MIKVVRAVTGPRPQGGEGPRRLGAEAGQGGREPGGGRLDQGPARGGRRRRRAQVGRSARSRYAPRGAARRPLGVARALSGALRLTAAQVCQAGCISPVTARDSGRISDEAEDHDSLPSSPPASARRSRSRTTATATERSTTATACAEPRLRPSRPRRCRAVAPQELIRPGRLTVTVGAAGQTVTLGPQRLRHRHGDVRSCLTVTRPTSSGERRAAQRQRRPRTTHRRRAPRPPTTPRRDDTTAGRPRRRLRQPGSLAAAPLAGRLRDATVRRQFPAARRGLRLR